MADDYSLPSLDRLIRLINEDNGSPGLNSSQLTVGTPEITTDNGRNTRVLITANTNSNLTGSRHFYYNRLHLTTFFDDLTPSFSVRIDNPTNTYDLLTPILEQYNVNLGHDDIRQDPITGDTVNLRAKLNSLAWRGNVVVEILPVIKTLAELVEFPHLAGFVYEAQTPTFAIGDLYINTQMQLLNLINNNASTTFTNTDVSVGAPVEQAPDIDGRNTNVLLTALPNTDYTGSLTVYYKRLDIEQFLPAGISYNGSIAGVGTVHQLMDLIRTATGIELTNAEVVNDLVPPLSALITITISDNSYVWEPGSVFTVYFSTMGQYHILDGDGYHLLDSGEYALLD